MRCHKPIVVKTPICDPRPKQAHQFSNRVDGWRVVSTEEPRLHGRSPLPTCAGMNSLHKTKCLGPRAVTTKHLHSRYVLSMQWEAFQRAAPRAPSRKKKGCRGLQWRKNGLRTPTQSAPSRNSRSRTRRTLMANDVQGTGTLAGARRKRKKKPQMVRENHLEKTGRDTRVTVLRETRASEEQIPETMDTSLCHQRAAHLPRGCLRVVELVNHVEAPKTPPDNSSCLATAAQKVATRWSNASINSSTTAECRRLITEWREPRIPSLPLSKKTAQQRIWLQGKIEHHASNIFDHNHIC